LEIQLAKRVGEYAGFTAGHKRGQHCRRTRDLLPAPCNNIRTMQAHRFTLSAIQLAVCVLAMAAAATAIAAPPTPPKSVRIIDTVCDSADSGVSPQGQFVCHYVCRDPDHTKVAVVYSTSGSGQCRTPINRKIKQYFSPTP
jgi:hypothetical protein